MAINQKPYSKERRHNPNRVAAGKEQAANQRSKGRWENDMTRVVRTSHLGYDCYATGKVTGEAGKIRCLLKSTRLPGHITHDIQSILPVEMWWPERDHRAAHVMIDAALTFDLKSMAAWKSLWPAHEFGFEQFMEMAERHLTQLHQRTLSTVRESTKLLESEARTDPSIAAHLPKPSLFPCALVAVEPAGETDHDGYRVVLGIARFEDGSAALRVTVRALPIANERGIILSRVYVDLITGEWEMIEHYPGRYTALGLPARTVFMVLGIRRQMTASSRRSTPRAPRPAGEGLGERSRRVHAAIETGDPMALPAPLPPPAEPPPPDIDVTVFPEAPGQAAV